MNASIIIECPNCGTKYKVIPEAIKPRGRTVHCTNCSNKWHVPPTQTEISDWEERFTPGPFAEEPVAEPEPKPELDEGHQEEPVEAHEPEQDTLRPGEAAGGHEPESFMVATPRIASEPEQAHTGKAASFGLVAATLILLAGGIFALHSQIVRLWPPSARLYQAVGVEKGTVPGEGLALRDVHAYLVQDGAAGPVLNLEAKVVNTLKTNAIIPRLDASLVSANGEPSRHWPVNAGIDRLEAGATANIKASFDGANAENGKILLTFSADNEGGSK